MKKFLIGLAALPFLAGAALAGQPTPLADNQMDMVTAGFDFFEVDINNVGTKVVAINNPSLGGTAGGCVLNGCFLNIHGTSYPSGLQSFQLQAQFGPLAVVGGGTP